MTLEIIRKKIDALDDRLLNILASRLQLVQKIGRTKKKRGELIENKSREEFILNLMKSKAVKLQLSTKFVEDIYKLILKESKKIQNQP